MEMSDYAVAVLVTDNNPALWDLARNQFGSATPMTAFSSSREVLGEVVDGRATLCVLPVPSEGDADPWWTAINVRDGLRISYRLPFASTSENNPQALTIGRVPPESSGQDRSLIVIETNEALSRAGVTALAERVGIKGYPIASCVAGLHFQLLEVEGFIGDDDTRLEELAKLNDVAQATAIGAYATPIDATGSSS
jgi:chorismate mutase/prephenate dehydratase